MRARLYWPDDTPRRTVLLVSGLNPAGIDEPRLVALARQLSATNVAVLTPRDPGAFAVGCHTCHHRLDRASCAVAGDHVRPDTRSSRGADGHQLRRGGYRSSPQAGRRSPIASPMSSRSARTTICPACSGICARALSRRAREVVRRSPRPPHDYGVAIILLGVAERLVPADQVELLRGAVRRFLWASYLDRVDQRQADREFAALRQLAPQLPEPSATLLGYVNDRDVAHLGPLLLPFVGGLR